MKLIQHSKDIWLIEGFLSEQACDDFIYRSEASGYEEAKVSFTSGAKIMKGLRNNERILVQDHELARQLWEKLQLFCPEKIENRIAVGLNEQFRFYKYEVEQRFKKHIDGRFKRNNQEESRITFMIYLNDDFEGAKRNLNQLRSAPSKVLLCVLFMN